MDDSRELAKALSPLKDRNLGVPSRPRIVEDLRFFDMPDGLGIQVRGFDAPLLLRGKIADGLVGWLMKVLDGTRSVEEIIEQRPKEFSLSDISAVLLLLFRKGLITETTATTTQGEPNVSHDEVTRRQLLFWGRQVGATRANDNGGDVYRKLAKRKVLLLGNGLFGAIALDILCRSGCNNIRVLDWGTDGFLTESIGATGGVEFKAESVYSKVNDLEKRLNELLPGADFLVTALRDCSDEAFSTINKLCLQLNTRWLRGHDDGSGIEVGPFVDPHSSACLTCMQIRYSSGVEYAVEEALYQEHLDEQPVGSGLVGESIAGATQGAAMLCGEAIRILTLVQPPICENTVLTLTNKGVVHTNKFRRVPRCPDCYRGSHASAAQEQPTTALI